MGQVIKLKSPYEYAKYLKENYLPDEWPSLLEKMRKNLPLNMTKQQQEHHYRAVTLNLYD